MKRLSWIAMLFGSFLLAGCSSFSFLSSKSAANEAQTVAGRQEETRQGKLPEGSVKIQDEAGMVVVQKVEFKSGVSSATVERLGRRFGCTGRQGAGLVTEKGPVEVYRVQCDNGTTFLAQCELRQCRPMR